MILPQEVAARTVIPALRAQVARKLIDRHGMTQLKVAEHLGITQAAVSNYVREARGTMFTIHDGKRVQRLSDDIATAIVKGADEYAIRRKFTEACNYIQSSRLMCDVHLQLEPEIDQSRCHICDNPRYVPAWEHTRGAASS